MTGNPFTREIPNMHQSLINSGKIKNLFPDMQFSKDALKELDNLLYLAIVKAVDRTNGNRRTRVMRIDV